MTHVLNLIAQLATFVTSLDWRVWVPVFSTLIALTALIYTRKSTRNSQTQLHLQLASARATMLRAEVAKDAWVNETFSHISVVVTPKDAVDIFAIPLIEPGAALMPAQPKLKKPVTITWPIAETHRVYFYAYCVATDLGLETVLKDDDIYSDEISIDLRSGEKQRVPRPFIEVVSKLTGVDQKTIYELLSAYMPFALGGHANGWRESQQRALFNAIGPLRDVIMRLESGTLTPRATAALG